MEGLKERIFRAEEKDNIEIWFNGIEVGEKYHIRPRVHLGPRSWLLETGNYTIAEVDLMGGICGGVRIRVEGDPRWFPFDGDWLIFSYLED